MTPGEVMLWALAVLVCIGAARAIWLMIFPPAPAWGETERTLFGDPPNRHR